MQPLQLFDPHSTRCTYVLFDEDTREALVIDPVDAQLERDLGVLRQHGLKLVWVVETGASADRSAGLLAEHTGARAGAPGACDGLRAGVALADQDRLRFGQEQVLALQPPGHAAQRLSYVWRGHAFTGSARLTPPGPAQGYAGDITPLLAWHWVASGAALLVDVRSDAEREWVGFVPGATALAWKQWPGMALQPGFDEGVRHAASHGKPLLMLCRSGVRSVAAARRATELGAQAYNILEGFEGDPDGHAHRGALGGWRFHGLPWRQN